MINYLINMIFTMIEEPCICYSCHVSRDVTWHVSHVTWRRVTLIWHDTLLVAWLILLFFTVFGSNSLKCILLYSFSLKCMRYFYLKFFWCCHTCSHPRRTSSRPRHLAWQRESSLKCMRCSALLSSPCATGKQADCRATRGPAPENTRPRRSRRHLNSNRTNI